MSGTHENRPLAGRGVPELSAPPEFHFREQLNRCKIGPAVRRIVRQTLVTRRRGLYEWRPDRSSQATELNSCRFGDANARIQSLSDIVFTEEQRSLLLRIARRSIEAAVAGQPAPPPFCQDPQLLHPTGAFVTIKDEAGQLRGCIGRLTFDLPLTNAVARMAAAAATQDPRFQNQRLRTEELADCRIEISVLSPSERIDNPLDFENGRHGIEVRQGRRTGCFLPDVATEWQWTNAEMLEQCCRQKAGLDIDAWRRGEVEVFRFTVVRIAEPVVRIAEPLSGARDGPTTCGARQPNVNLPHQSTQHEIGGS